MDDEAETLRLRAIAAQNMLINAQRDESEALTRYRKCVVVTLWCENEQAHVRGLIAVFNAKEEFVNG